MAASPKPAIRGASLVYTRSYNHPGFNPSWTYRLFASAITRPSSQRANDHSSRGTSMADADRFGRMLSVASGSSGSTLGYAAAVPHGLQPNSQLIAGSSTEIS